jgi:hypothetical protein
MEELVMKRPRLALALLQMLAHAQTPTSRAGSRVFRAIQSNGGSCDPCFTDLSATAP